MQIIACQKDRYAIIRFHKLKVKLIYLVLVVLWDLFFKTTGSSLRYGTCYDLIVYSSCLNFHPECMQVVLFLYYDVLPSCGANGSFITPPTRSQLPIIYILNSATAIHQLRPIEMLVWWWVYLNLIVVPFYVNSILPSAAWNWYQRLSYSHIEGNNRARGEGGSKLQLTALDNTAGWNAHWLIN